MGVYAKAIVAAILAGVTALQAAISDDVVTGTEWVTIGIAILTAIGVWAVPNAPVSAPRNRITG